MALLACCCAATGLCASTHAAIEYERLVAEQPHMGTLVRITAYAPRGIDGVRALQSSFARVEELSRRLSDYRKDSEVNQVSQRADRAPVFLSRDLFSVLAAAAEIACSSGGAFDVTSGALTRLQRQGIVPNAAASELARSRTGWQHVVLDARAQTVYFLTPGIQLDLGGIAKGYIADQALVELRRHGIDRALVAIAGDIVAGEAPPGESGWRVAIEAKGIEREIRLANEAVSTSGDRERSHEIGGVLYSHIVDPRSQRIAREPQAVSVIARSGVEADGWATALHVLGRLKSHQILDSQPQLKPIWPSE